MTDTTKKPTRRDIAKQRTQGIILEAGRKLFMRHGYAAATMRSIAAESGMSTGAIFANYKDKADLYRQVFGHDPLTPEEGLDLLHCLRLLVRGAEHGAATEAFGDAMNRSKNVLSRFSEEKSHCNT